MTAARIAETWLHYAMVGPKDGPVVVFVNSLGTDFRIWDAVVSQLDPGLCVLRYDMRGHGLSDAPAGPYSIAALAGDLAGLMDHLGLRAATVVGLSIGGLVAQGLASARPDLVARLVLSNTAARIGSADLWQSRIAAIETGGLAPIAEDVLARWFPPEYHAAAPDRIALCRNMLVRTPAVGYTACCAALAGADLTDATGTLRLPALAIAGSVDGSTPPDLVRATADLIPGAEFECIAGVGHIPCVQAPGAMAARLTEFLQSAV